MLTLCSLPDNEAWCLLPLLTKTPQLFLQQALLKQMVVPVPLQINENCRRVLAEYPPTFIAWIFIKKITFSSLLSSCFWYMSIFLPRTILDHIIFTCSSCLLLNTLCWFHAVLFHPLFNSPFSFSCFESALLLEQSCMAELFPARVSTDGSLKGQQQKGKLPVPLQKRYIQSAT